MHGSDYANGAQEFGIPAAAVQRPGGEARYRKHCGGGRQDTRPAPARLALPYTACVTGDLLPPFTPLREERHFFFGKTRSSVLFFTVKDYDYSL